MKPLRIQQPVQWKERGRAKNWMKWILCGNDNRTAKDKFEEYRAGIFPDKEHGLNKLDYNKI